MQLDVGFPIEVGAHLLPHLAELGAVASSARGEQQPFLYPPVMRYLGKELPIQHHRGVVSSTVAIGAPKLHGRFSSQCLEAIWGRPVVIRALERATRFRRFKATDVRAILMAGSGLPSPVRAGVQLQFELPEVPTRPLSAYAIAGLQ